MEAFLDNTAMATTWLGPNNTDYDNAEENVNAAVDNVNVSDDTDVTLDRTERCLVSLQQARELLHVAMAEATMLFNGLRQYRLPDGPEASEVDTATHGEPGQGLEESHVPRTGANHELALHIDKYTAAFQQLSQAVGSVNALFGEGVSLAEPINCESEKKLNGCDSVDDLFKKKAWLEAQIKERDEALSRAIRGLRDVLLSHSAVSLSLSSAFDDVSATTSGPNV